MFLIVKLKKKLKKNVITISFSILTIKRVHRTDANTLLRIHFCEYTCEYTCETHTLLQTHTLANTHGHVL